MDTLVGDIECDILSVILTQRGMVLIHWVMMLIHWCDFDTIGV